MVRMVRCSWGCMSTGRKVGLAIACVVVGFVLGAVLIAPGILELNQYRPEVVSYIEQQTGRRVTIGHLALSIFPEVAVEVDDFALVNPSGFPSGNWLAVKRINATLDFGALLDRRIVIRALKLERPVLSLLADPQGRWNFQISPPRRPVRLAPGDPPLFVIQEIIKLTLAGGNVAARKLQANGHPGPPDWNAESVSLNLAGINAAELNALGGAPPRMTRAPGKPPSFGSAAGQLSMKSFSFSSIHTTGLQASIQVSPAELDLNNIRFRLYGGYGQATFMMEYGNPPAQYHAETQLRDLNLAKLMAEFPSAQGQLTGTLDGKASFSGAQIAGSHHWDNTQGQGVLNVRNGTWPNLKIDPALLQLLKLAQLGPASGDLSGFSSISAAWRVSGGVVNAPSIRIITPAANVSSSGTVDLTRDDALSFHGVINITAQRNALSDILAAMTGGTFHAGRMMVPFVVRGTVKKPVFGLKTAPRFGPSAPSTGTR